ncbi:MAG: class I poly(R)-hydroxyalkanoic acid synthase [Gammaproteobacteria bacterium]|nr:class I poly(R)-hydroxyalkanoic acid synthase [Gammaproteobacteria bacterium]
MKTESYKHTGETFDSVLLAQAVMEIAGRSHELMQEYLAGNRAGSGAALDPFGLGGAFLELTSELMRRPGRVLDVQMDAWRAYTDLWFSAAGRMLGTAGAAPGARAQDRRFRHKDWDEHPFFDFLKQSYLIAAGTIQAVVAQAEGLDERAARKLEFFTRQFVDALSPANFVLTNPEVLEETVRTRGENLLKGLRHFIRDFDREQGRLRITMTDSEAFQLGSNVAVTPGKVVFQNELMQLIQYSPSTKTVFRRPLLLIPPWINKFYILDLQPANSFIKWLVDQGHTVFVISWVNPDASLAGKDFDDYLFEGPLAALDAMAGATGEREANVIGYCIGGTLLGAALAYMEAGQDRRFASATFLTSMLDFAEPGDLGVFVDEEQLANLERGMLERGYHEGADMAATFNLLRANDLIWSFYVSNYLLGRDAAPFDLLYWNSDSTRLPARMHSTYLRAMYLENRFKDPGGMTIHGIPIDLSRILTPSYFLSTEDDHIAPWRSTYTGAQLLSGPVRFVLGKSGHIAGVVNPPAAGKYGYCTGADLGAGADDWRASAQSHAGSWWPDWQQWIAPFGGDQIPARQPGDGALPRLEEAPGSYVKVRT